VPINEIDQPINHDNHARYWLALKFIPRLSIQNKLELVKSFGLMKLFSSPPDKASVTITEKQYQALISPDWQRIEDIIEATKSCGGVIVSYSDGAYPSLLKQIYDPPLVLFTKGNVQCLNAAQVAIVGSRNSSAHAREAAFDFSHYLANQGVVITSGLALGIDASAHKGVIAANEKTIAVVATGIDKVYPSRHKKLSQDIIANKGCIVSEFLPGTEPKPGHFPKRNRIISGLSQGVLVVEATIKSGSLITARCALEQNREVFALPSNINNPQAKGCHWLIKQGAKLVDDVADIIEELKLPADNGLNLNRNKDKDKESKKTCEQGLCNDPMLASVGYEITPVDTVVSRSKLPIDVVLTRLTMLELKGLVTAVPGGYLRVK